LGIVLRECQLGVDHPSVIPLDPSHRRPPNPKLILPYSRHPLPQLSDELSFFTNLCAVSGFPTDRQQPARSSCLGMWGGPFMLLREHRWAEALTFLL